MSNFSIATAKLRPFFYSTKLFAKKLPFFSLCLFFEAASRAFDHGAGGVESG
jgi:hypothetical protein